MFTDGVKLKLVAGKGGNGVVAWRREKFIPKGGPCGGNGGRGGSIIIKSSGHHFSLDSLKHLKIVRAQPGKSGEKNNRQGKCGEEYVLTVPVGTLVKDPDTHEILKDFTEIDDEFVICKGGKGGRGNTTFKTSTHQAPNICTPGMPGEEKDVFLELKLLADVGLIGMPSAGKSTLLTALTGSEVKSADYPFTTLTPNLGVVKFDDHSRVQIADIPGLIEGASQNKGLGHEFLRHIERSKVLVYVIDVSCIDYRDPVEDFLVLRKELESYSAQVALKPFLLFLNKVDKIEPQTLLRKLCRKFPVEHKHLFCISALTKEGLDEAIKAIKHLAQVDGKRLD